MTANATKATRLRADLDELDADITHHKLQITLMNRRIATLMKQRSFHKRELDRVQDDWNTVQQAIIDLMPETHND